MLPTEGLLKGEVGLVRCRVLTVEHVRIAVRTLHLQTVDDLLESVVVLVSRWVENGFRRAHACVLEVVFRAD